MMASKKELKAQITGLEAARDMALREAEYLSKRESARMRSEHAERQRKLKQAEREERLKRVENIGAGLLPLKGATQWAIVHEEGSAPGIEVFVPLSEPELRAAQDYLSKPAERHVSDQRYCEYQRRALEQLDTILKRQRYFVGV